MEFCETRFAVDFPLFEKIAVTGEAQHPLYQALVAQQPQARSNEGGPLSPNVAEPGLDPKQPRDVMGNSEKLRIHPHGRVVGGRVAAGGWAWRNR